MKSVRLLFFIFLMFCGFSDISAQTLELPGLNISVDAAKDVEPESVSTAMSVLALLTLLSLAPALLVVMTSFTRIIIVLSMLRHAIGLQSTPPNTVLIGLALFISLFTMMPVIDAINISALQPYMEKSLTADEALAAGSRHLKEFMISQTREEDLILVLDLSNKELPRTIEEVSLSSLVPAFMLGELQTAFEIGFVIFLPFLLIDILVASVLMSMGMIMLPPLSISLPIKILMFVLIDGWSLLTQALVGSFL